MKVAWLIFAVSPAFLLLPITHDAAWQMWIGRQLWHGGNLYSDIVEVTPPLWFWLGAPIAGISDALGLPSLSVLAAFFVGLAAASLWLCSLVTDDRKALFGAAVAMLVLPLEHFCQKEHWALIAAMPYVMLAGRPQPVSRRLGIAIGAFAAVGLCLKPHFLIVPALIELWRGRRIRPEAGAIAAFAVLYLAAIIAFEPDYFRLLPMLELAYPAFAPMTFVPLAGVAFIFGFPALSRSREAGPFVIAALGFYLAFLIQMKGFDYQALPAMGMLLVGAFVSFGEGALRKASSIVCAALILAGVRLYDNQPMFNLPRGSSFAALSRVPRTAWPMVEYQGLNWTLPFNSLWFWPTVKPNVEAALLRNPPRFLLIDDRRFDFSAAIPRVLPHYRLAGVRDGLRLYVLSDRVERRRIVPVGRLGREPVG